MPVIEINQASIQLGGAPILSDIDLSLHRDEVVWLRGPNGAGKSTLLRVMAGLIKPTTGSVHLFGAEPTADVRRRIGLVAHRPAFYEDLSLEENLRFIAQLIPCSPDRVAEALRSVGLYRAAERKASEASEGMRRRTDLARLLLTDYDVLLLDEAQSGLDADAAGLVEALVEQVISRGGACVLVSHAETVTFATREVVLKGGRFT